MENQKDKVAIVVVGYNRLDAIKRLLISLLKAKYPEDGVPLYISIDASGCQELYDYVESFEWPFGKKFINIQAERLGLRKHILKCGELSQYFKGIILLEDDLFVCEYFYMYALRLVEYYYNEDRIAGFSLYRNEVCNPYFLSESYIQDGSDAFLRQTVSSWGECWTDKQWKKFREWYDNLEDISLAGIDMPENIKNWEKAWSKFFIAYEIDTNRYFTFPSISHTTCFGDAGEHGKLTSAAGQVNFLCGQRNYHFRPFDQMVRYDIYNTNQAIYDWIGITKEELAVSFYGNNPNVNKKRYILSPFHLPFKIVKTYGLSMRPIEMNIKEDIPGYGIFLYDTMFHTKKRYDKYPSVALISYNLRDLHSKSLLKYLKKYYIDRIMILLKNK